MFSFLLTHYHALPYPKTYQPWQHGKLPVKESRDANLRCRMWRLFSTSFLPDCQQPHYPHHPLPPCPQTDSATLGNCVKSYMKLSHFCPKACRFRKDDGWLASQGFYIPRISIIFGDPRISIFFVIVFFGWAVLKRSGKLLNPPLLYPNSYTCATSYC